MGEFHFTWQLALKLFSALLILGVWFICYEQSQIEKKAKDDGQGLSTRRFAPVSNYVLIAAAIVFLLIAFFWGNKPTI